MSRPPNPPRYVPPNLRNQPRGAHSASWRRDGGVVPPTSGGDGAGSSRAAGGHSGGVHGGSVPSGAGGAGSNRGGGSRPSGVAALPFAEMRMGGGGAARRFAEIGGRCVRSKFISRPLERQWSWIPEIPLEGFQLELIPPAVDGYYWFRIDEMVSSNVYIGKSTLKIGEYMPDDPKHSCAFIILPRGHIDDHFWRFLSATNRSSNNLAFCHSKQSVEINGNVFSIYITKAFGHTVHSWLQGKLLQFEQQHPDIDLGHLSEGDFKDMMREWWNFIKADVAKIARVATRGIWDLGAHGYAHGNIWSPFSILLQLDDHNCVVAAKLVPLISRNNLPSTDELLVDIEKDFTDLHKLLSHIIGAICGISNTLLLGFEFLPYSLREFSEITSNLGRIRADRFQEKLPFIICLTDMPWLWTSNEAASFVERLYESESSGYSSSYELDQYIYKSNRLWLHGKLEDDVLQRMKYEQRYISNRNPGCLTGQDSKKTCDYYERHPSAYLRDSMFHYADNQAEGEVKKDILGAQVIIRRTFPNMYGLLKMGLIKQICLPNHNDPYKIWWMASYCLGPQEYCPPNESRRPRNQ